MFRVTDVTVNHLHAPLGIDARRVVLSWRCESDEGARQEAYRARVLEGAREAWDSGVVASGQQLGVVLEGFVPAPTTTYLVEVVVLDEHGSWSERGVARLETGLMGCWHGARWIVPEQRVVAEDEGGPRFLALLGEARRRGEDELSPTSCVRKEFSLGAKPVRARLYASAKGLYEVSINGQRPESGYLKPEVCSYDHRMLYQTMDVTDLLAAGDNALAFTLADGWYVGRIGLTGENHQYGSKRELICLLEVTMPDGTVVRIASDDSWRSHEGPIRSADLFLGERRDFSFDLGSWERAGFDDGAWDAVEVGADDLGKLEGQARPSVAVLGEHDPVRAWANPDGSVTYDFGFVMSGVARVTAEGDRGEEVVVDFAEVLAADATPVFTVKGRHKDHRDAMVLSGQTDVFQPLFTYHAFRYVTTSRPVMSIVAVELGSAVGPALRLSSSSEDLDAIQACIARTQRSNTVSVLTDNPSREKCAFTGDDQLFASTALYNADLAAFLGDWLRDCRLEQFGNGALPDIVPNYPKMRTFQTMARGSADAGRPGWGDASVVVPYELWRHTGDLTFLRDSYDMACQWMAYASSQLADDGVWYGTAINDVSHPHRQDGITYGHAAKAPDPSERIVDTSTVFATACYGFSAGLMSEMAAALGHSGDARRWETARDRTRKAFSSTILARGDAMRTQEEIVLALGTGMVEDLQVRTTLADRLCELIEQNDYAHDLGFFALRFLLPVLCESGHVNLARKVLFGRRFPSWLYEIDHDATTFWECWDNLEGAEPKCESYTQPGAGVIGEGIYEQLVGLRELEAGFASFEVRPHLEFGIEELAFCHTTPMGEVRLCWNLRERRASVLVPFSARAHVLLPGIDMWLKAGSHELRF